MELYCIISITDRSKAQIMQDLYASCGLHMIFTHARCAGQRAANTSRSMGSKRRTRPS